MSFTEVIPKARIEREARAAVVAGRPLHDACPYPSNSDAGHCFVDHYIAAATRLSPAAEPEDMSCHS